MKLLALTGAQLPAEELRLSLGHGDFFCAAFASSHASGSGAGTQTVLPRGRRAAVRYPHILPSNGSVELGTQGAVPRCFLARGACRSASLAQSASWRSMISALKNLLTVCQRGFVSLVLVLMLDLRC